MGLVNELVTSAQHLVKWLRVNLGIPLDATKIGNYASALCRSIMLPLCRLCCYYADYAPLFNSFIIKIYNKRIKKGGRIIGKKCNKKLL
jgi:hypothetical protein